MEKFGTFKLKNAVFITFNSKFYPRKRIGLVQSGQGLGSILYQNVWGLVTIFQGLLELLFPSYTVFANMLIPCALDEKHQYLPFRNYF